ncbi:signal recognition particle-docking protein FtsY [Noviherbaspirillum sedimenti]|uniref:Signal recognition particle receptor FtsY n=1 Tax=Noviherbaspirillum sedimenti TaxID=2320865 RepID=A0A3A3G9Z1_9BURK|nr:signal recognition particle-docking protein FtsY [Noviherbaspirillum sedimenti]RJG03569.1 signal recognition particle-docking protein FtsY [Noviherbaspirillum sedimenti]
MFSFFKRKPKDTPAPVAAPAPTAAPAPIAAPPIAEVTPPVVAEPAATAAPASVTVAPAAAAAVTAVPAITTPAEMREEEIIPAPAPSAEQKRSWLTRLKAGLSKTSASLTTLFVGAKIDDDLYEELESALLMADGGVEATQFLLTALKKKVKDDKLTDAEQVKGALKTLLIELLTPLQKPLVLGRHQPMVMMIAGVNGAGKTTTIGKLAKHLQAHRQSVLLAAGDTFRAAAREQLAIWGERNNVSVISQESGDPAAVAFDAVQSALARGTDVVMVDTAGRLPTQLHLMEELKKIKRVIGKSMADAPHEVLLVIDGNTGQNALTQVKAFDDALQLTGLVVTKLDGTAKGGVLAAIARTRPVPVYFIGVGEGIEDLQPFNAQEFVDALLS